MIQCALVSLYIYIKCGYVSWLTFIHWVQMMSLMSTNSHWVFIILEHVEFKMLSRKIGYLFVLHG